MTGYKEKLDALRGVMKEQGLDGFIVPSADEHQCEYPPPHARRLEWLTGFSGSAGIALVLQDGAVVLTDGRYIIQIKQQVDSKLYDTGNIVKTGAGDWLKENAGAGQVIGYDPWLHAPQQIARWQKKCGDVVLKPVEGNLIDAIWEDQPEKPCAPVEIFPDSIAGLSFVRKQTIVAESVKKAGASAAVLTLPDSVCWLLNVRGGDVDYTPLVLSYAILYADEGRVDWFVEPEKISSEIKKHLGGKVQICPPADLSDAIDKLSERKVLLDFMRSPVWFKARLEESGAEVIDHKDPCILPKACKTKEEQAAIEQAHIRDGVALVKFLAWLDEEAPKGNLTELDVVRKLEGFRKEDESYKGPSFATIAGFGPNGAVIHYKATEETNLEIKPPGLLLVDSGGQYPDGTTDITRTVVIGKPTQDMCVNFTRVLKGHIAVAMARFPEGTLGVQIDALARQSLWNAGLDYAHGTGHGVGCYLQVHEEAAGISPRGKDAFKPGMLISNEPGYYEEGAYGIRIESLVLVEEEGHCENTDTNMLRFKTVTLAPIDHVLIVADMLSAEEKKWLNNYHAHVASVLCSMLDKYTAAWLKEQTAKIYSHFD